MEKSLGSETKRDRETGEYMRLKLDRDRGSLEGLLVDLSQKLNEKRGLWEQVLGEKARSAKILMDQLSQTEDFFQKYKSQTSSIKCWDGKNIEHRKV